MYEEPLSSQDEDRKLEAVLQRYTVPSPSADLAGRIIASAAHTPQRVNLWRWIGRAFEECRLPAPAYSLASLAVLGFLAGFATDGVPDDEITVSDSMVEQLFYEDRDLL